MKKHAFCWFLLRNEKILKALRSAGPHCSPFVTFARSSEQSASVLPETTVTSCSLQWRRTVFSVRYDLNVCTLRVFSLISSSEVRVWFQTSLSWLLCLERLSNYHVCNYPMTPAYPITLQLLYGTVLPYNTIIILWHWITL